MKNIVFLMVIFELVFVEFVVFVVMYVYRFILLEFVVEIVKYNLEVFSVLFFFFYDIVGVGFFVVGYVSDIFILERVWMEDFIVVVRGFVLY